MEQNPLMPVAGWCGACSCSRCSIAKDTILAIVYSGKMIGKRKKSRKRRGVKPTQSIEKSSSTQP